VLPNVRAIGSAMRTSHHRRRHLRAVALLALAATTASCGERSGEGDTAQEAPRAATKSRSVILVTIDTLRADAIGAYGSQRVHTPVIDRLAAEGVLFEQAQAASPNTLPSHASLLTGLRPFEHGVRSNTSYVLTDRHETLAAHLRKAGFETAAEVAAVVLKRDTGIAQGFEHFRDPESPGVERMSLAGARVEGKAAVPDHDDHPNVDLYMRGAPDITRSGIEFLQRVGERPYFLWLHYFDPHFPYAPPEELRALYPDQPYFGEVAWVDRNLGRLVEEIERLGLRERTLLVLTSDHGEGLGEHGENTHSFYVYQSTMRVPLVLWGPPDLSRGMRVPGPVQSIDVAPTILSWLGVPPLPAGHGIPLLPLPPADVLEGRAIYGESVELDLVFGVPPLRFVRQGAWKYVHKTKPELYDVLDDPGEQRNVIASQPERAAQLRERLVEIVSETPSDPAAASTELDPEHIRQLESLGYLAGGAGRSRANLDSLELTGVDPNELAGAVVAFNDARGLLRFGDPNEGVRKLHELSQRYPQSSPILETLLDAQLKLGRADDALATLRRGIAIDAGYQRYWSNLAELLLTMGRREEALRVLRETIARWPCDAASRGHLAELTADRAARIALLDAGVRDCEPTPGLLNDLAFLLAASPQAELRDGARAVALSERAAAKLVDNPLVLDTVAAAYAESGRFDEARRTSARAVELAERQRLPAQALELLRNHAALIQRGEPIRE
jgi:arylsulfatase A-like enzyme